jgi:dienelactone hydrolase
MVTGSCHQAAGTVVVMAHIALFHSVLGVRPGVTDAAARLRAAGHRVLVVDQYGGRVFDDYDEAGRFAAQIAPWCGDGNHSASPGGSDHGHRLAR